MKNITRFVRTIQFSAARFLIFGLLCTGGCVAVNTSIEPQQTPSASLNKYKIVAVDISTQNPNFDSQKIDQLTGSVLAGLRKSGKFEKVYAANYSVEHNADLKLSVVVKFAVVESKQDITTVRRVGEITTVRKVNGTMILTTTPGIPIRETTTITVAEVTHVDASVILIGTSTGNTLEIGRAHV